MATSSAVLSKTLQSLTTTKVKELRKQKEAFEDKKSEVIRQVDSSPQQRTKVKLLLKALVEGDAGNLLKFQVGDDPSFERVRRFLDQSEYDSLVDNQLLGEYEADLRQKLGQQTTKFEFADLYSRLLTEWLTAGAGSSGPANDMTPDDSSSMDGSFAMVEKDRLQQLRDKFAEVVFTPLTTDDSKITEYLEDVFGDDDTVKPLAALRARVQEFGRTLANRPNPFDQYSLKWAIKGLLKEELLSEEKRMILEEFHNNPTVLTEISDVLNMRFRNLAHWSWDADDGMVIQARPQLNGKWRVMMDEDILQALLLHYVAVAWCVEIKDAFRDFVRSPNVWKHITPPMSREDQQRMHYFTNRKPPSYAGLAAQRQNNYDSTFFLTHLPNSVEEGCRGYEEDNPYEEGIGISPVELKQMLLRQLATEAIIQQALHGEAALIQTDLKWYATSLGHSTIFAVWKFFGLSDFWMDFFRKFLEPPIQMSEDPENPEPVRVRKRGVQMSTAFEQLFGEIVLFPLDIAVNRKADGLLLYRIHDDIWLCGQPVSIGKAWEVMNDFCTLMGLEFNMSKTGAAYLHNDTSPKQINLPKGDIRVGFLRLEPEIKQWVIDKHQVSMHAAQLKKQLDNCTSIFSWVQTWNSCIGRFFNRTFGAPANCFGRPHVNSILQTHKDIHHSIFGDRKVTDHLRDLVAAKFGVTDLPDAFFFFPEELGGLGLRNPFIDLLVSREQLYENPWDRMEMCFAEQHVEYERAAALFAALTPHERKTRARHTYGGEPISQFCTFEEYVKNQEQVSTPLVTAYTSLMEVPSKSDICASDEVRAELSSLVAKFPNLKWWDLDSERKWILQLYSESVLRTFGGLEMVDKALLPLGVMTLLRGKKVSWQAVL
ncbi:uncharacterized protein KY384_002768 [Bacidia gigantensis]|uniref:uncharacterized protein n=1 Tax=Bacidia gigantensis TaxID=2732470 RepID=UPI001D03EA17|nr:uncharacterized protein KY384_002768 [Bacidia gigantensis]KAG8532890.1 hypothetical protein KY384_002768 [Bacidia gigantensis]